MCGIAGFLGNNRWRDVADFSWISGIVDEFELSLSSAKGRPNYACSLEELDKRFDDLMSYSLFHELVTDPGALARMRRLADLLDTANQRLQASLLENGPSELLERMVESARDYSWQIRHEVLGCVARTTTLMPASMPKTGSERSRYLAAWSIEQVLENIDRLEVRGRDSAGISIQFVISPLNCPQELRASEELFEPQGRGGIQDDVHVNVYAMRLEDGKIVVTHVYKVANLVGRLGDNTAGLRKAIRSDNLLWLFSGYIEHVNIIAHTRWASNGIISLANCHPVDGTLHGTEHEPSVSGWGAQFVLNGDVDNYQDLVEKVVHGQGYVIEPSVTTDAKILPVFYRLGTDCNATAQDRFATLMNTCDGSLAVVMQHPQRPYELQMAQKGSGQSLFVGVIRDGFILASEVYGLASLTRRSYSMVGNQRGGSQARIEAGGDSADLMDGRFLEDSLPFQLAAEPIYIHSRDIFRGAYRYYFEKEIHEAPLSVLKTIKGKYRKIGKKIEFGTDAYGSFGKLVGRLRDAGLPPIRRIMVIGQGTASVAAMGVAYLVERAVMRSRIAVGWSKASEMSGFFSDQSLEDMLVIAISQSGTTTDTNRTVDVASSQGAWVHAIVNRRNSSLVEKADSHFYTSDGRDVEMAVASTKAFYSQVAAGKLTALMLARELESLTDEEILFDLEQLEKLPGDIQWVLEKSSAIKDVAEQYGPSSRNWAVVGNGPNKIAADEIRIKLSELCYKSIPCDFTEDKKHIDLSTEPLTIVVCNDLPESVVQDTAKEVAIFKAHNGKPLVICARGERRFRDYAESLIEVPNVGAGLGFVLATVAGHLWGFHAAKAIDARADVLRNARTMLTRALEEGASWNPEAFRARWTEILRVIESGEMNSALPASSVGALALFGASFRFDDWWREVPEQVIGQGIGILNKAIEELTRPIDTIRHQAKTVTVGISRPQEMIATVLLKAIESLSANISQVKELDQRLLRTVSPVISDTTGGLYYSVVAGGDGAGRVFGGDSPLIHTVARFGSCLGKSSRYDEPRPAGGSKKTVLRLGRIVWSSGRAGVENLLLVPLYDKHAEDCTGILLFHLVFAAHSSVQQKIAILRGLGARYHEVVEMLEDRGLGHSLEEFIEHISPRDLMLTAAESLVF